MSFSNLELNTILPWPTAKEAEIFDYEKSTFKLDRYLGRQKIDLNFVIFEASFQRYFLNLKITKFFNLN